MWLSKLLTSVLILFMAGACGFQPLYGRTGNNAKVQAQLSQTYVLPIEGRTGQILRNNLLDRVTPTGVPANAQYRLSVQLTHKKSGVAIDKTASTNRYNLNLRANYTLTDSTGKIAFYNGVAQSISSYNVVDSDFANLSAEKNAEKRSAIVLAEEIHRQLSVFFSR
ncbi:hypothetical protein GUA87_04480 [Sneathiella sp. P13V-1]|uniref:LPS assembly lipoprotein LptE n=1 Tax=Sneathiella sp. P13V-1 TaxID=2697366 RepID=UPI00187B24C3|nr:LPS assembly lipoprotein LptE [Sneathiella sp. P13V-1]MBE7636089.1 hypothetical protein [Sneathiella sp. P13V-1]